MMRIRLRWVSILALALSIIASRATTAALTGDWLSGYLSDTVYELTGRRLVIAGKLSIDWGLQPSVRITNVRLDNPEWASRDYMAKFDELVLQVDLASLVGGSIRFPELRITGPEIWLEVDPQGKRNNWTMGSPAGATVEGKTEQALSSLEEPETKKAIADQVQELDPDQVARAVETLRKKKQEVQDDDAPLDLPQFDKLLMEKAVVHYRDRKQGARFSARVENTEGSISNEQILLDAQGALAQQPLRLKLRGGSLTELHEQGTPYPFVMSLVVGGSELRIDGNTEGRTGDARLTTDIKALLKAPLPLAKALGYEAPLPSPFSIQARIGHAGPEWRLSDFVIRYAKSRITGEGTVDTAGDRPRIEGRIDAGRLDIAPFLVADTGPSTDSGPLDLQQQLARLQTFDANLKLRADELLGPNRLSLQDIAVDVVVDEGELEVGPTVLQLGGGTASATLKVDSNAQVSNPDEAAGPVAAFRVDLEEIDVGRAGEQLGIGLGAPGLLQGVIDLHLARLPETLTLADTLHELRIDAAQLQYLAPEQDTELELRLALMDSERLQLTARGHYQQQPIELDLRADPPGDAWDAGAQPYAVTGSARAFGAEVELGGSLGLADQGLCASLALRSERIELAEGQTLSGLETNIRYAGGELSIAPSSVAYENTAVPLRANARFETSENKLQVQANGRMRKEPFNLNLTGGQPWELVSGEPYAVTAKVDVARSKASVDGTIDEPLRFAGLHLRFDLSGPTPAALSKVAGVSLPDLPPYRIRGRLGRSGSKLRFEKLNGRVGDSDLGGSLTLDASTSPPRIDADLRSNKLDFDDLGTLVGAAPDTGAGETASGAQRRKAKQEAASPWVLPREPLGIKAAAGQFNGRIKFTGRHVQAPSLPLDQLRFVLNLDGNKLKLEPLSFGIGKGRISGRLEFDANGKIPKGKVEGKVVRVNLRNLLNRFEIGDDSVGTIGGQFKFWVAGDSVAELLASADGGLFLLMTGGKLDQMLVEIAGLDFGEALITLLGDAEGGVPIDCAYLDAHARSGFAEIATGLVDTSDTLFLADGSVDFDREMLDLVIDPRPKDFSLFSARAPLFVKGRFASPSLTPGPTAWLKLGAAPVLGATLTPLAALLPLIEPGDGKEPVYCRGLVDKLDEAR